jgi:hypothetical protein
MIDFLLTKWHILIVAIFLVSVSAVLASVVQTYFGGETARTELESLADAIELFYLSGKESYVYELSSSCKIMAWNRTISLNSLSTELLVSVEECDFETDGGVLFSRSNSKISIGGV